MQEGSGGRRFQSRHDGEKGERQEETGEARGGSRMSQHWQQGLGIMREGIQNVPVLAAGIGEGEGRDLECPSYVLGWQGKRPFCP